MVVLLVYQCLNSTKSNNTNRRGYDVLQHNTNRQYIIYVLKYNAYRI